MFQGVSQQQLGGAPSSFPTSRPTSSSSFSPAAPSSPCALTGVAAPQPGNQGSGHSFFSRCERGPRRGRIALPGPSGHWDRPPGSSETWPCACPSAGRHGAPAYFWNVCSVPVCSLMKAALPAACKVLGSASRNHVRRKVIHFSFLILTLSGVPSTQETRVNRKVTQLRNMVKFYQAHLV